MTRREILETACTCVCGDREEDYGRPENNFKIIADFWTTYLQAAHPEIELPAEFVDAKDVSAMMSLLKIARIAAGTKEDSFVDLAGYAACGGEICTENKDN